ncbi:BQ2448_2237 [Microbotryum intermedium]|uniref:BQ2448_2237 protein n=1 Tax=Microbotryum intermedium TaxID=269621 RepID=A0A238F7U1_9BASI|nr:BQ2448_2237 [Microbotryum intermedium]
MTTVWTRNLRDEEDFVLDYSANAGPGCPWRLPPLPLAASVWPVAAASPVPYGVTRREDLLTGSASTGRQRPVVPSHHTQDDAHLSYLASRSDMSVLSIGSHRSPLRNLSPFQTIVSAVSPSSADRTGARPYRYPTGATGDMQVPSTPPSHCKFEARLCPTRPGADSSKPSGVLGNRSQHAGRTTWSSLSFSQSLLISPTSPQAAVLPTPRFITQLSPPPLFEHEVVAPTPIRLTTSQNSGTAPCAVPNRLERSAPNPSWLEDALYGPAFGEHFSPNLPPPAAVHNRIVTRKPKVSRFKRIRKERARHLLRFGTINSPAPAHMTVPPYSDHKSKPAAPQAIRKPFKQRSNRNPPLGSGQA